ncbi:MAG: class I SAM-dependent DNA methyltransferase, partial [Selenomonadaceae bacterium]|nr:class I SAM-dependent DNA methyltransferase [Selenomonadaceae bacterium]
SGSVVYNNFPWCLPTLEQKKLIEQTAQKILDVRANYPDATLADLYDELTMPQDLRLAHKKNDRAVAAAYGFENFLDDESKIVAELMKLYERFTNK